MSDEPAPRNSLYRQETRSRRRLTRTRLALYRAGVPVAEAVIRAAWRMSRVVAVLGEGRLEAALAAHGAVIPVYWHQHQLLPLRYLLDRASSAFKPAFLVSPSVDGEMPAMLTRRFGGTVVRGSSSATGAQALRDFYEAMTRDGVSPVITPDGPRGPAREFKAGAILLAQLSGKPMLPFAFASRRIFMFPNWDQFILPLPFTPSVLAIGEPQAVPKRLDTTALSGWQERMQGQLVTLYREARGALARR